MFIQPLSQGICTKMTESNYFSSFAEITEKADITFALDTSEDVSEDTLRKMVVFIKQSLNAYNVSKDSVRISIINFGSTAASQLSIDSGSTVDSILESLKSLASKGGRRRLDMMLWLVARGIYRNRRKSPKSVIMFINGPSRDNLASIQRMAKYIRDLGADIKTIATENANKDVLRFLSPNVENRLVISTEEEMNKGLYLLQPSTLKTGIPS